MKSSKRLITLNMLGKQFFKRKRKINSCPRMRSPNSMNSAVLGIAHGRKRRRAGSLVGQQEAGSGGGSEPQAPPGADISGGMLFSGPSVAM